MQGRTGTLQSAPWLFNASLRLGCVPQAFMFAYITPLLEKLGLDSTDAKNYQPILNLTVISNLLERVIAETT